MSYAQYLWVIARVLQQNVRPELQAGSAESMLGACVNALAGMAASLEQPIEPEVPGPLRDAMGRAGATGLLLSAPPENLAARGVLAGAVAAGAAWFDQPERLALPQDRATARELVAWERRMLDAALEDVVGTELLPPAGDRAAQVLRIDSAAAEAYLRECWNSPSLRIEHFHQPFGGRSKQTALVTVAGQPEGMPAELVIRRDHPQAVALTSVAAEYPLLCYLHESGLCVPRPLLLEISAAALGAPFMIVGRVPGRILGDTYLSSFFAPQVPERLAIGLAGQLGRLHSLPVAPMTGKLRATLTEGGEGWRDDLARIATAWRERSVWPSITVSAALAWLERHVDSLDERTAIVHNDMVFHNILVEGDEIAAVLDWELAHIGHPGEDIGYSLPSIDPAHREAFLAAYLAAGGAPLTGTQVHYFSLRAALHLLTLCQGSNVMFRQGLTDDVMMAEIGAAFTQRLVHRLARLVEDALAAG